MTRASPRDEALEKALEAMKLAVKIIDYFANNRTSFVGPGTPTSCIADLEAAIAMLEKSA